MNKMMGVGIIGLGNMGSAIAARIKNQYPVFVFDKDQEKLQGLQGVKVIDNIKGLLKNSDVVILAVKPQHFSELLAEIKKYAHKPDKLIISIAAGITTRYIEDYLGLVRVVRVMPNMPAKVGSGMSCLSQGKFATQEDFDLAQDLFSYLGETLAIKEEMMNAATAISGSGPGYLYNLIEGKSLEEAKKFGRNTFLPLLKAAAEEIGFNSDEASLMASVTTVGSLEVLAVTKLSPAQLKEQVASKGGTTEAGLEALQKGGSIKDAVTAALKRADELSDH